MQEADRGTDDARELALLLAAAEEAGRIAMRYFRQSPEVWMKEGNSPVSEADFAVDRFLRNELLQARPDYGWISEETRDERAPEQRRRAFVIDPIDGTRAYLHGEDTWCVSLAIVEDGRPIAGVLQCPARDEVISARSGKGAWQNGEAIHTRLPVPEQSVTIASARHGLPNWERIWQGRVYLHPYIPSLAYRIAMVARGDLSGTFVRPNSHDWDLAAADLILAESGGAILTSAAKPIIYGLPTWRHGSLVAASGRLLDEMLSVVAGEPLS
ncbi:3'(2'),5'-bisphosphate nucleotidase CysQ [Daeguia caeni]|uniref:3'(2'),5'-bisphosphate nucleotidase CysQ n=1 Tax=Daeguia caeni TaxID=439612 RepID=A0ABV9H9W4_9HYPH